MQKYIFLLGFLILFGCSQKYPNSPIDEGNGTDNPTIGKLSYFPNDIGNYWVYEKYELDSLGKRVISSLTYDSVVVDGELKVADKFSKLFVTFSKQSNIYSRNKETYYASEESQLLSLENYLSIFVDNFPLDVFSFSDTSWVKLADPKDDLWRLYRQKFENSTIPGIPFLTMTGKADVLGSYEGTQTLSIAGKQVTADVYLISFDFNATINIPFIGAQNIVIQREMYQYYSENIGLVKTKLNTANLNLPILGAINLPGFETNLIKYSIK